jgi:NADH:ubiquinone oxidoreductase subunit C
MNIMLANFLKKNMNIILINTKTLTTINYFIIYDFYIQLYLRTSQSFFNLITFLKYSSFFNLDILIDIKCEDICFFSKKYRFKVTYVFLSLTYNVRYFIAVFLKENESLKSLENIYSSSSYLERQI